MDNAAATFAMRVNDPREYCSLRNSHVSRSPQNYTGSKSGFNLPPSLARDLSAHTTIITTPVSVQLLSSAKFSLKSYKEKGDALPGRTSEVDLPKN